MERMTDWKGNLLVLWEAKIIRRILLAIGLSVGLPQLGVCNDTPGETVESAYQDYSAVVYELPWEFDVASREVSGQEERGGEPGSKFIRYDYVSKEPIKKVPGGGLYLKAELNVTEYMDKDSAMEAWGAIIDKAHPDMGLSYAWDHLIYKDRTVYHMHAACTFSEESFDVMTFSLRSTVVPEQHNVAPTIHCRCGGGCIVSGQGTVSGEQ